MTSELSICTRSVGLRLCGSGQVPIHTPDVMGCVGLRFASPGESLLQHFLRNDVGGPMCRTVEDVARVMDVIAGFDPADQITANARGHIPATYLDSLNPDRPPILGEFE